MKSTSDMTFAEMAEEIEKLRSVKPAPTGPRMVCIIDRGWIFAGDASPLPSDHPSAPGIRLNNAVWLFRWESIGYVNAIKDWKSPKVDIRPCSEPVDVPRESLVFSQPVEADWGVK